MVRTPEVLKSFFEEGTFPSPEQFGDLIDTIEANGGASVTVYSGYNADAKVDDNGNGIPPAGEEYLGRKYRVTVAGTQDFGQGPIEFAVDDIIVCVKTGENYFWRKQTVVIGNYLPLAGGTMEPDAQLGFGTGGQYLAKGSFDRGGDGGISNYCAIGYEQNWQAGSEYIYDASGFVRVAQFKFTAPDSTADVTQRYIVGSRWVLDNGDSYICTDNAEGAAVWELQTVGLPEGEPGEVLTFYIDQWFAATGFGDADGIGALSPMYRVAYDQSNNTSFDWGYRAFYNTEGMLRAGWEYQFTTYNDLGETTFRAGDTGTQSFDGIIVYTNPSEPELKFVADWEGVKVFSDFNVFGNISGSILQVGDGGYYLPKLLADNAWIETEGATLGVNSAGALVAMESPLNFDNSRENYAAGSGAFNVFFNFRKTATFTFNATANATLSLSDKNQNPFKKWDDEGQGGGLYTLHIKNNFPGTPSVISFNTADFKLQSGTSVTVGEPLDAACRVFTIQFLYYAGKLREIKRTDMSTGILLD